jgi:hypothetical protein
MTQGCGTEVLPTLLAQPQRMNVWIAVGILIEHDGVSNGDALAASRAYPYGHGASLDDIADRSPPDDFIPTHSRLAMSTQLGPTVTELAGPR